MPSAESKKLIEMLRSQPRPSGTPSPAERRARMESFARPPDAGVVCEPVDAGGVPGEWIEAPGAAAGRTLLYLHGGGYAAGSIVTHRQLCGWISKAAQARVLAIDYRLAPEHPFPAALDDALAAYRWLLAQGMDPSRMAVAGDSAGGGLAAATLVALRDAGDPLPAAGVLISPWMDLAGTGDSIRSRAGLDPVITSQPIGGPSDQALAYIGGDDACNPLISPLYADLRGLPPLLIQVGTEEVLVDDATRFDAAARTAGVETTLEVVNGQVHVWHVFAWMVPEAREAIASLGRFIVEKTAA